MNELFQIHMLFANESKILLSYEFLGWPETEQIRFKSNIFERAYEHNRNFYLDRIHVKSYIIRKVVILMTETNYIT